MVKGSNKAADRLAKLEEQRARINAEIQRVRGKGTAARAQERNKAQGAGGGHDFGQGEQQRVAGGSAHGGNGCVP